MFRRFFKRIGPHIGPEFRYFLYFAIPVSLVSMFVFVIFFAANAQTENPYILGFLLSIGGVYLMRLIAWVIKDRLIKVPEVYNDIYYKEEDR